MKLKYTLCLMTLILCIGQYNVLGQTNTERKSTVNNRNYVPIDFNDTNYSDVILYARDTVTADGWSIKYLVKNDNKRYNDIYIEWSKGDYDGLYLGSDVLQFRRYFIPEYVGETKTHLFLSHGCATDCSAILVLSKNGSNQYADYQNVVAYNVQMGLIVNISDSTYLNEDKVFELNLSDLNNAKQHKITINSICTSVFKPACVDTVIFEKEQVVVKASLRKSIKSDNYQQQTIRVDLTK